MISYAQNAEDVLLARALSGVNCGFYVDVGANDPVVDSVTYAFYTMGWTGLNIEPAQSFYEALKRDRPRDNNVCVAISDRESECVFYEVEGTGISTIVPSIADAFAEHRCTPRRIRTRPLCDILDEFEVATIHFLKIDVEGAESLVLRGCDFTRHRPWIVLVEAVMPGAQTPVHRHWEDILLNAGYRFTLFDGLNRYYVANEKAADIESSLSVPVNLFDSFIRNNELAIREKLAHISSLASDYVTRLEIVQRRLDRMLALYGMAEMKRSYDQYAHTLAISYLHYGVEYGSTKGSFLPFSMLAGKDALEIVQMCVPAIKARLAKISQNLSDLIIEPAIRRLAVDTGEILIPLLNKQGYDWYANSPPEAFDFTAERKLGLLDESRVVYDLGGHHGVWAAYYARLPGVETVYSFEPSIINVEVSALLMFINGITNVSTQAMAVGAGTNDSPIISRKGLLIDFVEEKFLINDFAASAWQSADFIKIDIEGYEYELVTNYDWVFDMTTNMHLELHIPHLERRGLDYRRVYEKIPFEKFDVYNSKGSLLEAIEPTTELSGYCSLLLKRK
ncbi:hypothetical protein MSC49_40400 (plasmid) [Methylosinus sp. C49]|uniref:FkbM family methyltransferase n=1 Tax=Methylosinus sp. C49 TaxID=2699395 RepID=UPI0013672A3A|nr:FkbM family methyltransferase [Methylosinus sp. C49]BBU64105.1 hypothetical protein MSC49_40400 [Methylosinus sp. C49]